LFFLSNLISKNTSPPLPCDLLGDPDEFIQHTEQEKNNLTGLLQDNKNGSYLLFLEQLLSGAVGMKAWKKSCKTHLISEFVEVSLEAFAVIVYVNGYDAWNKEFGQSGTTEGQSVSTTTGSTSCAGYRFTGDSKRAKKWRIEN